MYAHYLKICSRDPELEHEDYVTVDFSVSVCVLKIKCRCRAEQGTRHVLLSQNSEMQGDK